MKRFGIVAQATNNPTERFMFATFDTEENMQFAFEAIFEKGRAIERQGIEYILSCTKIFANMTTIRVLEQDLKTLRENLKPSTLISSTKEVEHGVFDVDIAYDNEADLFSIGVAFGKQKTENSRETEFIIEKDDVPYVEEFLENYQCKILANEPLAKQINGLGEMAMLKVGFKHTYDLFHLGFSVGMQKGVEITDNRLEHRNIILNEDALIDREFLYAEPPCIETQTQDEAGEYKCDCAHNPNCQCEKEAEDDE